MPLTLIYQLMVEAHLNMDLIITTITTVTLVILLMAERILTGDERRNKIEVKDYIK